jgi:phage-related protein
LVPQLSLSTTPVQPASEQSAQAEQPAIHSSDNNLMGVPPPVRRVSRFQVSVVKEGEKPEDAGESKGKVKEFLTSHAIY